ncbi:MAG: ribosome small subunit-dependent GTPase A [Cyclobacteriaceae bacterium]
MKGLVMKSTGSWYSVRIEDGRELPCRTRGKLRLEGYKESNPIAVGDHVEVELSGSEGVITFIHERENHMLRQSVKKTGHSHVLAANLDQVMLMASLRQPRTSMGFIDRFLVTAEAFRIPQILLLNKTDLLDEVERTQLRQISNLYQSIGIQVREISVLNDDLTFLKEIFKGKVTLLAGHSGVGKSSLLNRLVPGLEHSVAEISDFSEKGVHTTTFAEMISLDERTFIIDTPGVKEWGLVDMTQQEISDYFPEMRDRRLDCKFGSRCLHINEPKCAIIAAAESGTISATRYQSYLSMVLGEDNRK